MTPTHAPFVNTARYKELQPPRQILENGIRREPRFVLPVVPSFNFTAFRATNPYYKPLRHVQVDTVGVTVTPAEEPKGASRLTAASASTRLTEAIIVGRSDSEHCC